MKNTLKDDFLKSLSESSFKELERKGKEPTSPEETQELLDFEIMEPTEPDVWEMYRRDPIDEDERDRLLSPFRYQRKKLATGRMFWAKITVHYPIDTSHHN